MLYIYIYIYMCTQQLRRPGAELVGYLSGFGRCFGISRMKVSMYIDLLY